jgi:two-component system NtrC family sensor kinase
LLSFARQHKPERVPVRLNAIVEDTLALRDYDLRMSQIRVRLELAADLPQTAADPHQLQQVFLNLINNAVDAILETAGDGDLRVRSGVDGKNLFVEFTDSGTGVKDASRVFDPFYTTKPVGKGTGLGLSICYGIITEHGGTIQVRNETPSGATFRVELPLLGNGNGNSAAVQIPVKANVVRGARILVVDTDDSILETVAGLLGSNDYIVKTTKSFADARKFFAAEEFDLVLADWQLAAGEAAATPKDAKSGPLGLGSRILWMSAVARATATHPWLVAADSDVLQKPFQSADLLAAVDAKLQWVAAPLL